MEELFPSLAKVIVGLGDNNPGRKAIIFAAWRRAAGDQIAGKTEPTGLDGDRLVVEVNDDAWIPHLRALAPQMLARVNKLVGDGTIKRIEFH